MPNWGWKDFIVETRGKVRGSEVKLSYPFLRLLYFPFVQLEALASENHFGRVPPTP
jgi:hypothetical protein